LHQPVSRHPTSCCTRFAARARREWAASPQAWRQGGKRGIWLRVPIEKAAFLEPAIAAGFVFHHAEPSYVMCTHWLSADLNKLPANASHQVLAICTLLTAAALWALARTRGDMQGSRRWAWARLS